MMTVSLEQCLRSTTILHLHASFVCPHIKTSKFYMISTTCHTLYRHSLTRNSANLALDVRSSVSPPAESCFFLGDKQFWKCRVTLGKIYVLPSMSIPVSDRKGIFTGIGSIHAYFNRLVQSQENVCFMLPSCQTIERINIWI